MTQEEIRDKVVAKFPQVAPAAVPIKDYATLRLKAPSDLVPVVEFLKKEGFDYLEIVTAVDWAGPVKPEGFIREPNPNVFLPEGATPQITASATTGVNYRPAFDLVWALADIPRKARVFLKLEIPRDNPKVPSLTPLFKAADWQEREAYDLLGIRFEGHPNLVKILTPDFTQGHPLRKDYVHVKDKYDS